jgi:hypothetical protein
MRSVYAKWMRFKEDIYLVVDRRAPVVLLCTVEVGRPFRRRPDFCCLIPAHVKASIMPPAASTPAEAAADTKLR